MRIGFEQRIVRVREPPHLRGVERGNDAKSVGSRGGSQVLTPPLTQVLERLISHGVKLACRNVPLDLAIPLCAIEFCKPFANLARSSGGSCCTARSMSVIVLIV